MGKKRDREQRELNKSPSGGGEPLVVDLPDGQKLYVGALEDGMAIEVATWRGVGEPDSRVARMIIAANRDSSGRAKQQAMQASATEVPPVPLQTSSSTLGSTSTVGSGSTAGQIAERSNPGMVIRRDYRRADRPVSKPRSTAWSIARRVAAALVALPLVAVTSAVLSGWLILAKPIPSLASELNLGSSGVILAAGTPTYQIGDEVLARVSANSNQAAIIAQVLSVEQDNVTIIASGTPVKLKQSQILGRLITTLPIGAEAVDRPLLAAALIVALLIGALVFAL